MKKIKNVLIALAIIVTLVFSAVPALAYFKEVGGGQWSYGGGWGRAFSNYYHGKRGHSSTVISRDNGNSDKGYANAGKTSYATINTAFGEKCAFYYDFTN